MAAVVETLWEKEVNNKLEYNYLIDLSLDGLNVSLVFDNSTILKFYKPQKCSHRSGKCEYYIEPNDTENDKEMWAAKTHNSLTYNCIEKIETIADVVRIIFTSTNDGELEILSFWYSEGVALKI